MIQSVLILDSSTKVVINRVSHDPNKPGDLNLLPGTELSSRHDGDIGWTLLENGEWLDPNPPERVSKAQGIRNRRDYKLKDSDKYAYPDFPLTEEKRNEWLVYRQALRDITIQSGFPENVVWPTKPT